MKRNIGKHVSSNLRQMKEDMRELQRLMTHKSVYARVSAGTKRHAKHPKRALDNY